MVTSNRKEYLLSQKNKGKAVFGVFPAQYPKELLWALDIVPAEIWDPPLQISGANAHLQSYICSIVRLGMELVIQGKCDFVDGFLFPHTCDSIQNMASVINDYMGPGTPCYFFYHPKAPYSPAALKYYLAQLKELAASLQDHGHPLDKSRLRQAIGLSNTVCQLLNALYTKRSHGALQCSNREFFDVIRLGEYLLPEDHIPLLQDFIRENAAPEAMSRSSVILSGVIANPLALLDKLDELHIMIANDDLINASRRLLGPPMDSSADPFEAIAQKYFNMPPCSTRGSNISDRARHIVNMVEKSGAKGVIFNIVKFCEPELFDVPNLQSVLKEKGIPSLVLDTEVNQGLSGQMLTRIEAFVEMLESKTWPLQP